VPLHPCNPHGFVPRRTVCCLHGIARTAQMDDDHEPLDALFPANAFLKLEPGSGSPLGELFPPFQCWRGRWEMPPCHFWYPLRSSKSLARLPRFLSRPSSLFAGQTRQAFSLMLPGRLVVKMMATKKPRQPNVTLPATAHRSLTTGFTLYFGPHRRSVGILDLCHQSLHKFVGTKVADK